MYNGKLLIEDLLRKALQSHKSFDRVQRRKVLCSYNFANFLLLKSYFSKIFSKICHKKSSRKVVPIYRHFRELRIDLMFLWVNTAYLSLGLRPQKLFAVIVVIKFSINYGWSRQLSMTNKLYLVKLINGSARYVFSSSFSAGKHVSARMYVLKVLSLYLCCFISRALIR